MTLKLKTTSRRAVFSYENDGMAVSWELRPEDDGPAVIAKLERMLAFLRREQSMTPQLAAVLETAATLRRPAPQRITSGGIDVPMPQPHLANHPAVVQPPLGAPSGTGTLMQQGLQQAKQFTGIAPVQPIPLQESIAKAAASGWELYTKEELADG